MDLTKEQKEAALTMDWYDIFGSTSVGMSDDEKIEEYKRYFLNDEEED